MGEDLPLGEERDQLALPPQKRDRCGLYAEGGRQEPETAPELPRSSGRGNVLIRDINPTIELRVGYVSVDLKNRASPDVTFSLYDHI